MVSWRKLESAEPLVAQGECELTCQAFQALNSGSWERPIPARKPDIGVPVIPKCRFPHCATSLPPRALDSPTEYITAMEKAL